MKLNAILVDDEPNALEFLSKKLREIDEVEVVAKARSVADGLLTISNNPCDVVFLDVELSDGTGFDLLRQLDEINFYIVFITAYNRYALEAFKVHAIDYLLKPIQTDELNKAINAVKKRYKDKSSFSIDELENLLRSNKSPKKIAIRSKGKILFINLEDVIYIRASGQYSEVFTEDKVYLNSANLGYYENLPDHFFRVHRSYIIHLNKVREVLVADHVLILSNGDKIPFSNNLKKSLLQKLGI